MARGVFVLPASRFCERRWAGGANHHDVQSQGREAEVLSKDRFVKIMAFCHMLPGPEALQLPIYVGYLKRRVLGGVLAGLTFIIPGAAVMILLSWLYVKYDRLPQVDHALYVL